MSFFSERWIKSTRKRHVCGWCGKFIEAGSAANYSAGHSDGDFWDMHAHPECAAARDSMRYDELCDGFYPGEFARGRTDDDFHLPPAFKSTYRGKAWDGQRYVDVHATP